MSENFSPLDEKVFEIIEKISKVLEDSINDRNQRLKFYEKNRNIILLYLLFLAYLFFQILPLPINTLKIFNPEKLYLLENLNTNIMYSTISLSPIDTYFQILNYISLLLIILIFKMLFYTNRHRNRFNIFMSFLGFISSIIAVYFYLSGNKDILLIKNSFYPDSATGFFINRTVSAIFLLFCLISSFELFKEKDIKKLNYRDNYFLKIYLRLFIIFITLGIITSFSRIANFLLLITVLYYLFYNIYSNKDKSFNYLILFVIIFDIAILGIYFGSSHIIDRFSFLKEEFASVNYDYTILSRLVIAQFSLNEIKNFIFFGYGAGAYEYLFQLKFINMGNNFANHAHSDIIEFFGEFGLLGFTILSICIVKILLKIYSINCLNFILISFLIIILAFDFSFHIPLIQVLFVLYFSLNKNLFS